MNPYLRLVILLPATMLQCILEFLIFTLTVTKKKKFIACSSCNLWCVIIVLLFHGCSSEGPQNRAGASVLAGADHPDQRRQPVRRGPVHLLALHHACQDHQGLPHRPRWSRGICSRMRAYLSRQPFKPRCCALGGNDCDWTASEITGVPARPEITGFTKPATEGDTIALTCVTTGSKPAARIQWLRNDKEVQGERVSGAPHPLEHECQGVQLLHSFSLYSLRFAGATVWLAFSQSWKYVVSLYKNMDTAALFSLRSLQCNIFLLQGFVFSLPAGSNLKMSAKAFPLLFRTTTLCFK